MDLMQTSTARYECLTRCFIAIAGLLFANSCLSTAMKCTLNAAVLVVVVAAAHFATGVIGGVGISSLKESTVILARRIGREYFDGFPKLFNLFSCLLYSPATAILSQRLSLDPYL